MTARLRAKKLVDYPHERSNIYSRQCSQRAYVSRGGLTTPSLITVTFTTRQEFLSRNLLYFERYTSETYVWLRSLVSEHSRAGLNGPRAIRHLLAGWYLTGVLLTVLG